MYIIVTTVGRGQVCFVLHFWSLWKPLIDYFLPSQTEGNISVFPQIKSQKSKKKKKKMEEQHLSESGCIYKLSFLRASPLSSKFRLAVHPTKTRGWAQWQKPLCAVTPLRPRAKTMKVFIDGPHCYSRLHWGPFRDRILCAVEKLAVLKRLWACVCLCWLRRIFQRRLKGKYWERHISLHNMKLKRNDRVVFSGG